MNLNKALRISPGSAAAWVGAGGKSAAIARLVAELEGDFPVVVTTTTHLGVEQPNWAQHHLIDYSQSAYQKLLRAVEAKQSVLVTGPLNDPGDRWTALNPASLEDLWRTTIERGGILLIEADGARRRWIKAPDDHEPAVPAFVDLVVPVVGMHALGRQLNNEVAHRPAILADRLGIDLGDSLEEAQFVSWATSSNLALKNVPDGARVRVLINQVDSDRHRESARRIATQSLQNTRIEALTLANIGRKTDWMECIGRIAGIVLAAGGSSRAEGQKLLFAWQGKPLVRHVVEQGLEAGLEPMVVVLGESADSIHTALADLPVVFVTNPDWPHGQSTSVRCGLGSLDHWIEGAVFLLGDMPLVTAELIRAVIEAYQRSLTPIVAPWADERWGNPALFDKLTFTDLEQLEGDQGGRYLFNQYPPLPVPAGLEALFDCDTPEDLEWLISQYP